MQVNNAVKNNLLKSQTKKFLKYLKEYAGTLNLIFKVIQRSLIKVFTEVQTKIKSQFIFNKMQNGFQFMMVMEEPCVHNF